jgi:hypothetical protein
MRNVFILIMVFVFNSCGNYDFQVASLKQIRIKFENLPQRVKNFYVDPSEFGKNNASLIKFACLDELDNYSLETVGTWIGPWVAYYKLIDNSRNVSYRIDQGTPIPYVVYENNLYLTDSFNIFITVKDIKKIEFTRYTLK